MKPVLLALGVALCMASLTAPSYAQSTLPSGPGKVTNLKTVSGRVTDNKGAPVDQAVVLAKGTKNKVLTNDDGTFSLEVPDTATVLTASHVGMSVQEVNIAGKTMVEMVMQFIDNGLNDVIVVGYGTKKKTDVLGAVTTIKAADIEDLPVANLAAAMVNRLPGVGISFASGKPGSPVDLRIRNAAIFAGASGAGATADPLFVIDGITVSRDEFDNLDASMLESITFLKDASAAIYGAAGAKGVVLVTTKKGKIGKPRVSYTGYFGTSDAAYKPKVMTAYEHAKMLNDGYELSNAAMSSRFSQADLETLKKNPYESWYDQLWHAGNVTRHTLNVSGGTEKVTFFVGGNYYNEGGNYGDISIKKYGLRSGLTAKITSDFTVNVNVGMDYSKDNRNTYKNANPGTEDISIRALYLTPQWVPLTIDGKPVNWTGISSISRGYNPLALNNSGTYIRNDGQGLNLNTSLEYHPSVLPGFTAKVQYGKLNRNGTGKQYYPNYTVYNVARTGQNSLLYTNNITGTALANSADNLQDSYNNSSSYQLITSMSYTKHLASQDFDVMVAMDQSESNAGSGGQYKTGQLVQGIDEFWAYSNAAATIQNPSYTANAKRSFLGRLNYSLMGKYLLEAVARYDASANFPPGGRWGLFPSIGLGWKISNEKFFMDHIHFIDFMKIRGNYGIVGEDRVSSRLWQSRFTQTTGALFGTAITNGLDPNKSPNPEITWEKARTMNLGFDVTVLHNHLNIGADFFRRDNYDGYDALENGALPATTGLSTAVVNYGKSSSWGSEFSLGYTGNLSKDWGFNASVNFSFSNSVVEATYFSPLNLGLYGEDQYAIPVGRDPRKYNSSNYGYISKGMLRTQAEVDAILAKNPNYKIGNVKPQVGFLDFEDINGDGQITDQDVTIMYNRTTPVIAFGMNFGFAYKSFKLSTSMNLSIGGKRFVDGEAKKTPTTTQNAPAFWVDHWTPSNPTAKYPRFDAPLAKENSTFWVLNGTQSRISNMTLSYALPKPLSERLHIPDLRVLITGNNLWTLINPYNYKEPGTSNFADYPTLRTISVGVNASF